LIQGACKFYTHAVQEITMRKLQIVLPVVAAAFSLSVWAAENDAKKKHPPTDAVGGAVEKQKSPEGAKTHPPTGAMDKAMPTQKTPEKK
jgi:hypothetical protein